MDGRKGIVERGRDGRKAGWNEEEKGMEARKGEKWEKRDGWKESVEERRDL